MANVEHSSLTTTNLHENKGVSTATTNTVATAVAGATVWAKLTADNLTGTGNSFGGQLLHLRDEKTIGTQGGTFTSGNYRTRTLNTVKTNEISGASLASNQITLPAGTYFVEASAPCNSGDSHVVIFQNVSDATTPIIGQNAHAQNSSGVQTNALLKGRFTIAGTKVFELQHRCTTTVSTTGFGFAMGVTTEVYTEIMIWKVL